MAAYSISYDLKKPGRDYTSLFKEIKSIGDWAKPLESYWIVISNDTPEGIYKRLRKVMDENDLLIIIRVCRPHYGFFNKDVQEWIAKNVPQCG